MKPAVLALLLLAVARHVCAGDLPLKVDAERSSVEIAVKATVDSFVGRLERYDASILVDSASGQVHGARFAFHFVDVKTGKKDRDEQMNLWQDTAHHPDGVFQLVSLERDAAGALIAKGRLGLHDVVRDLSFPVSIARDGARYVVEGEAVVDTRDFGLPIIRKVMVLKVDPEVHVRFVLRGTLGDASP